MEPTTIGKRIAAKRKEKQMTQEALAERMGVTPQAVSRWENDQTCPDITILPQLAHELGMTVDELLSGKTESLTRIVPRTQDHDIKDMLLHIIVEEQKGETVRINIPMSLVQVAFEMGVEVPQVSTSKALSSIDFKKIMELVEQGVIGRLLEIETGDAYVYIEVGYV